VTARAEVGVVGAGIVGLAIARALAERSVSVVVYDRSGVGAGASGVQPGGVRAQWGTEIACRLAVESAAFWAEADERLESRVALGFRRCGYLFVAHTPSTLERLAANVAVQNAAGVPSRIVAADEAAELVPGLDATAIVGGSWCGDDGYFDRPQSVVEAFARGLRIERRAVASPDELDHDVVVVAAGADSPALVPGLPIEREDRFLLYSEAIQERLLEPLVVSAERHFAAKQLANGRVLASDLAARGDESGAAAWRAHVREVIGGLLPILTYVSFPILVRGEYDVTPDHQPVLGRVDDRVLVAAGFSGHGFMIAPAIGRIVAEAVVGGPPDDALAVLDPRRFEENRLVPEPQLV